MKHKIYCFINSGNSWGLHAVAIAEDGNVLARHVSSTEDWARHDLGIDSNWKHDNYNAHYGEGNWKLEWVDAANITTHDGLQRAFALNAQLAAAKSAATDASDAKGGGDAAE